MIHPKVLRALEEIDAAVMNGDTFHTPEARAKLAEYIDAWLRELSTEVTDALG